MYLILDTKQADLNNLEKQLFLTHRRTTPMELLLLGQSIFMATEEPIS
jgi:hypothetical protein